MKTWDIITYNCRTLTEDSQLTELKNELEVTNWSLIGLPEMRRYDRQFGVPR
ncbi:unnamed protein product [Nezara viridula]|uniref:Uncharacterized protein n=1 Tax=Nezara viridula TaxID=85310 RepID=A0A9P0E4K2_NEZVI|nr:unnamed protein product [Nezara viridula]